MMVVFVFILLMNDVAHLLRPSLAMYNCYLSLLNSVIGDTVLLLEYC